jgi:hypothetical protein
MYMLLGLVLQSVGTYMFAATYYIDDAYLIVIVAIIARIISGTVLKTTNGRECKHS